VGGGGKADEKANIRISGNFTLVFPTALDSLDAIKRKGFGVAILYFSSLLNKIKLL